MELNNYPNNEKKVYEIGTANVDQEAAAGSVNEYGTVKRGLKSRHIQFIAVSLQVALAIRISHFRLVER